MSEEIEVVGHLLTRSPKFQDRLVKSEEGAAQAFLARGEGAIEPVMTVAQHKRIVEQYKRDAERMREALELWLTDYDEVALNPDFEPYQHVAVRVEKTRAALSAQPGHIGEANKMVKPAITSEGQLVELLNNVTGLHEQCAEFTAADVWAQLVKQQAEVKP